MKIKNNVQYLPLYVVLLLTALICWGYMSRFSEPESDSSAWSQSGPPRKDSLTAERHFGYIAEDKFLEVLKNLDRVECRFEVDTSQAELMTITKSASCFEKEFEELFFNAFSMQVFLSMPNNPIQKLEQDSAFQFSIPRKKIEGRGYVLLPYDLLMGIFQALDDSHMIPKKLLVKN